jgi:fucose 4-O-acetylase-like acetyltransferase
MSTAPAVPKDAAQPALAQTTEQHNSYLDVLKGFAISLVVLGHSIQTFDGNGRYDSNVLFRIIYSFHMPLFMFLAGAVASYSPRPMDWKFFRRKFYQLIVPFVSWYLVGYFLTNAHRTVAFGHYLQKVVESPDNGLWFLPALFLNFCCLALAMRLSGRFKSFSYLFVWLTLSIIPTGKYGIGLVRWHFPFFLAGYLLFRYRSTWARHRYGQTWMRYRQIAFYSCAVSFVVLASSWHRLYYPTFIKAFATHLNTYHIAFISAGSLLTYRAVTTLYAYIVPFTGIVFFYMLFRLRSARLVHGLFGFMGIYTLDIYVSQGYFFRFATGKSWLEIATGFIAALAMSLALGKFVLRRVPVLSKVFLGGRAELPLTR